MKKKYRVILLLSILLTACAVDLPVPPAAYNTFGLTMESDLENTEKAKEIEAFYQQGREGTFTGADELSIYFKVFRQKNDNSPAIMISSGRTEAAIKYKELIFDLYKIGYSVYIHDHRGQGLSGRMLEDPDMGYVREFQHYIDDMHQFYRQEVEPKNHKAVFLIAHSMGGAIGMTYLEQFPDDFQAASFSSPMLELPNGACGGTKLLMGKKIKYAMGQGPYREEPVRFSKNKLTGSELRYNRMNAAYLAEPRARLGGATYQWVNESCDQFEYMEEHIGQIETPFIIFSAENEQIVKEKGHQRFVELAQEQGKDARGYLIHDAQHELLIEKDQQRMQTINQTLWFFESILNQKNASSN